MNFMIKSIYYYTLVRMYAPLERRRGVGLAQEEWSDQKT